MSSVGYSSNQCIGAGGRNPFWHGHSSQAKPVEKGCAAFHSRRESITGESPSSFPEQNTPMPYPEPEPTWLQAKGNIHHTGWLANH
ncbi:hypothetical protein TNCV_3020601 [Trichonephila clavipes]|nr:hypothetical protein TNCV_3020601 [Trichonephila clavipes]